MELCDNQRKVIGVVAYMSKTLHDHEINWPICERDSYAIVFIFFKWRHYLVGPKFLLRTDHESLQHILKEKGFKRRLARWWDDMTEFNFDIQHIAGTKNYADQYY